MKTAAALTGPKTNINMNVVALLRHLKAAQSIYFYYYLNTGNDGRDGRDGTSGAKVILIFVSLSGHKKLKYLMLI